MTNLMCSQYKRHTQTEDKNYTVSRKIMSQNVSVISSINLGQFWQNLVHSVFAIFAAL